MSVMRYWILVLAEKAKQKIGLWSGKKCYFGRYHTGKVCYEYHETESGRIYDGNFIYIEKYNLETSRGLGEKKASGHFDNNRKSGKWIYKEQGGGKKCKLAATYANGKLNGPYHYRGHGNGRTLFFSRYELELTMADGAPTGDFRAWIGENVMHGQFDLNGRPDGLWKFSVNNEHHTYIEQWEHGILRKAYSIDLSTGDQHTIQGKMLRKVIDILQYECYPMENIIKRSDLSWDGSSLLKFTQDNQQAVQD